MSLLVDLLGLFHSTEILLKKRYLAFLIKNKRESLNMRMVQKPPVRAYISAPTVSYLVYRGVEEYYWLNNNL